MGKRDNQVRPRLPVTARRHLHRRCPLALVHILPREPWFSGRLLRFAEHTRSCGIELLLDERRTWIRCGAVPNRHLGWVRPFVVSSWSDAWTVAIEALGDTSWAKRTCAVRLQDARVYLWLEIIRGWKQSCISAPLILSRISQQRTLLLPVLHIINNGTQLSPLSFQMVNLGSEICLGLLLPDLKDTFLIGELASVTRIDAGALTLR